jgi:ribosome-associated protein
MDLTQLEREVVFTAVRSRGPGGQNVNKVSSAALANWNFMNSKLLTWEQKARLFEKAANHINAEGLMHFRADEFRDLERNKARCLEKIAATVKQALHVPKKRKATKPTKSSKIKRREQKSRHSQTKKLRGRVDY